MLKEERVQWFDVGTKITIGDGRREQGRTESRISGRGEFWRSCQELMV